MARGTTRNGRTATVLALVAVGMVGMSFAAVPLYRLFCQVTGYGGTTQVAEVLPDEIFDRVIKIRFNADKETDLPWYFRPAQREVSLRVGESGIAFYRAQNLGDERITGTAVYNVTPLKVGPYFAKIDCFCFTEQVLEPGAEADLPVTFFIDPAIMDDADMDDVKVITLSYTFYRRVGDVTLAENTAQDIPE